MISRVLAKIPLINNKTKILISTALVVLAFCLCLVNPTALDKKICLIAMLFSFIGDILLNCMPIDKRPHKLLYAGAFFFMIAHLVYASAFYLLIYDLGKPFVTPGAYIAYAIMAILFIVSIICIYARRSTTKFTMIFVFLLYLSIVSINFITIYSYSFSALSLAFIGATSFLISDYIIGIETIFKIKSDTLRKLVWIFYPIGQIMILICR